jgi:hypothetical protein
VPNGNFWRAGKKFESRFVPDSNMTAPNGYESSGTSSAAANQRQFEANHKRWQALMRDPQLAALATLMAAMKEMQGAAQTSRYSERGGVGFAAEDVNALIDEFRRQRVVRTGHLNQRNGPDRTVNGFGIQTKYWSTASRTFSSAFDQDGRYRYGAIQLEVPKDQYEECLWRMRQAITEGRVPGVTDPGRAEEMVRSGQVTFAQARNIARFGTVESIKFDAINQAIEVPMALGLSLSIEFALGVWSTQGKALTDPTLRRTILKSALRSSLETSTKSFVAGMLTRQVLRTRGARVATVAVRDLLTPVSKTPIGKDAIQMLARLSGRKLYGAAATNWVSKVLRTNAITATAMWLVQCSPDMYRASIERSISWQQCLKNAGVSAVGIAGGTGGMFAGAAAGAALGSVVPVIGTAFGGAVGGVLGSLGGGLGSQLAAQALANWIHPDDALQMYRIFQDTIVAMAEEHCVLDDEFKAWIGPIAVTVKPDWLKSMYACGDDQARKEYVIESFLPALEQILCERVVVAVPDEQQMQELIEELSGELDDAEDAA